MHDTMPLTPTISLAKLYSLRGRERLIRIAWGAVRWLAVVVTLLTMAFFIDWRLDKTRDTPMAVRITLTVVQVLAALAAGWYWLLRPMLKGPSLIPLARRVEKSISEYDHRLITSIQLSQRDAQVEGMSPQLIEMVTAEAEKISSKHDLTKLADTKCLQWSMALLAWPLLLAGLVLLFFKPTLAAILLQRQALANIDIPRDIQLKNATAKNPWPENEEVIVRYEVTSEEGKLDTSMKGIVIVHVEGKESDDEYDLIWDEKSEFDKKRAIFMAKVAPSKHTFTHEARIGDGRTRKAEKVTFSPRPVITIDRVTVKTPVYVPGQPEVDQDKQEIRAYSGSSAKVRIHVQKPIKVAKLLLYRRGDTESREDEIVVDSMTMKILEPETAEDGSRRYPAESDDFALILSERRPKLIAYRVTVRDENDFDSSFNPRGSIKIDDPPLPYVEVFEGRFAMPGVSFTNEDELSGFPIPLGGSVKIEYYATSKIGLRQPLPSTAKWPISPARLVYRINDEPNVNYLVLDEIPVTQLSGEYDARGFSFFNKLYQKEVLKNRVEFAAEGLDAQSGFTRLQGGGTFDFQTNGIKKKGPKGELLPLAINDRIEFYLEVYDCDPSPGRLPGVSKPYMKEIQSEQEVAKRVLDTLRTEQNVKDLETKQTSLDLIGKPKK